MLFYSKGLRIVVGFGSMMSARDRISEVLGVIVVLIGLAIAFYPWGR